MPKIMIIFGFLSKISFNFLNFYTYNAAIVGKVKKGYANCRHVNKTGFPKNIEKPTTFCDPGRIQTFNLPDCKSGCSIFEKLRNY